MPIHVPTFYFLFQPPSLSPFVFYCLIASPNKPEKKNKKKKIKTKIKTKSKQLLKKAFSFRLQKFNVFLGGLIIALFVQRPSAIRFLFCFWICVWLFG